MHNAHAKAWNICYTCYRLSMLIITIHNRNGRKMSTAPMSQHFVKQQRFQGSQSQRMHSCQAMYCVPLRQKMEKKDSAYWGLAICSPFLVKHVKQSAETNRKNLHSLWKVTFAWCFCCCLADVKAKRDFLKALQSALAASRSYDIICVWMCNMEVFLMFIF